MIPIEHLNESDHIYEGWDNCDLGLVGGPHMIGILSFQVCFTPSGHLNETQWRSPFIQAWSLSDKCMKLQV